VGQTPPPCRNHAKFNAGIAHHTKHIGVSVGTAEMDTTKILLNSVISTPGAKFCTADVTNFYLNTPMEREEYVRIPINLIPPEIIGEYKLMALVDGNGSVLARVDKGMYGLPQAGMLANKLLKERLAKHSYAECTHTPGLWRHSTRPIIFALVVDDFGIQYTGIEHAHHLIAALKQDYEAVTTDWKGELFCGITLQWDYDNRIVNLSMPGYVEKALREFQEAGSARTEHQPYRSKEVQYGAQLQLTDPMDTTNRLNAAGVL
jgi:Reverse transcriptase (RNA-dependent DNA polymerase)